VKLRPIMRALPNWMLLVLTAGSCLAAPAPRRIVSLAPSVTETLFALGLGPRVVGVTDWCTWPPEARDLPKIGGHIDPNFEAVVSLEPDLAVLESVNSAAAERLAALDVPYLQVEHRTLAGILDSLDLIGERCDAADAAAALREGVERRLAAVRARVAGAPRPRALVIVGRSVNDGELTDVYVAGGGTFLGELLDLAGGENAYAGSAVRYPTISAEGLMRIDPEAIIELAPEYADDSEGRESLLAAWRGLDGVAAARDDRIEIFCDDWMLMPGPRCVETLERLAAALHPEPEGS